MPVRAERMKNGAETKVWARITAIVVNGTEMPRTSNGVAEQPAPAEDEQQRQAGDRRRQDDRQVDDRLEPALAAERPPGQDERERQPEDDRDDEADRRRDEAQPQRVEDDRRSRRRSRSDPSRTARTTSVEDRQAEEQREERRDGRERPLAPAPDASSGGLGSPEVAAGLPRDARPLARSRRRQEPEARPGSPARRGRRTSRGTPSRPRRSATP